MNDPLTRPWSRRNFIKAGAASALVAGAQPALRAAEVVSDATRPVRKVFAVSYRCLGGADRKFLLMHHLLENVIGKPNPRICYMPAASGDKPAQIAFWYETMLKFKCQPRHQRVYINTPDYPDWESEILAADAVFIGGGNTLNMMAVFRAQGIDRVLRTAWERGVVMSGESAGANCWFETCDTDSRPGRLSATDGLGFLRGSMVPHLDVPGREDSLRELEKSGALGDGYAGDEGVAFSFENDRLVRVVKNRPEARAFQMERNGGAVRLTPLPAQLLGA